MRKFIFPAVLLLLCGCTNEVSKINENRKLELQGHVGAYTITEFEYDGCQYVAFGVGDSLAVSHKGNCKYCANRNK